MVGCVDSAVGRLLGGPSMVERAQRARLKDSRRDVEETVVLLHASRAVG